MIDVATEFNRGCTLFALGNFGEAESIFRMCLDHHPREPDFLNALGSALDACGRFEEAARYLKEACVLRPGFAPFRYNFANVLRRGKQRQEAEREYLEAVRLNPELAEAYHGLGTLFLEDGDPESAEACLQKAVALAPALAPALHDLGQFRQTQGKNDEAEQLFRQSLAADARHLPALNALGMLLLRANRVEEARRCFEQALTAAPGYLQARCNLGVLATWCGELETAIRELRQVVAAAPEDADAHFNLSLALLAAGFLTEGWREYEWRFRKSNAVPLRHAGIAPWKGEPLDGKRILIHAEQGYGDSLQFVRYARLLADQGAKVVVEGQDARITPLLSTAPGVNEVFSREDVSPHVDMQVPMMSLPFLLGERSWPPPSPPYLYPQPDKARCWNERLASLPGLKVGLAWAGRPEHENDANRSLPENFIAPLAAVEGLSLVSLQFGPATAGSSLPALHDFAADVHDFSDSAALIQQLDLVITVDSAVAHLAGALGVTVWLLLPWNPDWRWMRDRRDTPWYPGMKIYRQSAPGSWVDVIAEVARDLSGLPASPDNAVEQRSLPGEMLDKGDVDKAWEHLRTAIALDPDDILSWRGLVNTALYSKNPLKQCLLPEDEFLAALRPESNNLDELAATGLFFIRRDPRYAKLLAAATDISAIDELLMTQALGFIFKSGPLKKLCELTVPCDPEIESLFTSIRRVLMCRAHRAKIREHLNNEYLPFICSLATLCFNNEYIFSETEEEVTLYQQLRQAVENAKLDIRHDPGLIALLGTYYPLHRVSSAPTMLQSADTPDGSPLVRLLKVQVQDPLEENRLSKGIQGLTAIADGISKAVRQQYEENPYPRWVGIRLPSPRPMGDVLRSISAHLQPAAGLDLKNPRILIAGCGTGQHPIFTAARFEGSTILAIDLSLASLAYAKRKANEMGVSSIEFMQGDILALDSLDQQFDVVECGGVLHHLYEPIKGWQTLLKLLKPGGVMGIGLYSRLARRFVNEAKKCIAGKQSPPTPQTIRRIRQEMQSSFPSGVTASKDFYTMSGCRDLLLHVQEHQFDLEQVASMLRELKLDFLGFQLSESTMRSYAARFPEDVYLTDLARWRHFEEENPDTFMNMYQFYVRKPE